MAQELLYRLPLSPSLAFLKPTTSNTIFGGEQGDKFVIMVLCSPTGSIPQDIVEGLCKAFVISS